MDNNEVLEKILSRLTNNLQDVKTVLPELRSQNADVKGQMVWVITKMESMEKDISELFKVVKDGNGKPAMTEDIAVLKEQIKSIRDIAVDNVVITKDINIIIDKKFEKLEERQRIFYYFLVAQLLIIICMLISKFVKWP